MTEYCKVLTAAALIAFAGLVNAQTYPTRPIHIITPNPPGGGTDLLARLIGPMLTEALSKPVVVENRGGGNGFIGGNALAKAAPDGHTIMVMSSTHIITPLVLPAPYDPILNFSPVCTLAGSEFALVLHPSVPANSLQQLVKLAKSKPGQLNHASTGGGTPGSLALELFNIMNGVKILNIPYKGGGPALTGLLGGEVHMFINNPVTLIPHIKSGKIKGIAISGEKRSPAIPEVPTFAEAGLPGFDVKFWYGVLAPFGTSKQIIQELSAIISKGIGTPTIKERLSSQALDPLPSTPDQFANLMKTDMARYARIIKTANIKINN